jgi:hypothetical protein
VGTQAALLAGFAMTAFAELNPPKDADPTLIVSKL